MKRSTLTVDDLRAKGYTEFEFSDYTLEKAVERIKAGAKCTITPSFGYSMVGVVDGKEMFWREMTDEERELYGDVVRELEKRTDRWTTAVARKQCRRK